MMILKLISTIILITLLRINSYCQEPVQSKFENAINYFLENNENLARLWLSLVKDNSASVFDYQKIIGQKMEFFISDTLSMRGLLPFKDSLNADKNLIGLTESGIDNLIAIDKQSKFEPHSDSLLKSLIITKEVNQYKDFKIVFSEPFKNTLRAELWYTYFGDGHRTRFGDSLMILFWFNVDSTIKKVYFIRAIK